MDWSLEQLCLFLVPVELTNQKPIKFIVGINNNIFASEEGVLD
jgi:hypothetical protein